MTRAYQQATRGVLARGEAYVHFQKVLAQVGRQKTSVSESGGSVNTAQFGSRNQYPCIVNRFCPSDANESWKTWTQVHHIYPIPVVIDTALLWWVSMCACFGGRGRNIVVLLSIRSCTCHFLVMNCFISIAISISLSASKSIRISIHSRRLYLYICVNVCSIGGVVSLEKPENTVLCLIDGRWRCLGVGWKRMVSLTTYQLEGSDI